MLRVAVALLMLLIPSVAQAEGRFALLIGNQAYSDKVGRLKNPHNDIALVDRALRRLAFNTTVIEDAGYKGVDTALRRHIQQVRRAGKDTISFIYYSGHGAADPDTQINYLIPVDVPSADDAELWTNSLELREIIDRLRDQSPEATHFVVFDACREELQLPRAGKKAPLGREKGFVPVSSVAGVMIAYATAPGKTASDAGEGSGPYAKALAEEIVKPGIEAVMMFRNVQLKVKEAIGQDPWLSFPTLPAVYFAGIKPADLTPEQRVEMAFWASVKDSTNPSVLRTYPERYPDGEFAPIAHALIEHYERQTKAEAAAREEEVRRREEERKTAELKRLEDEKRAREAALAEERKRAEAAKNTSETLRLEEKERSELFARNEELRKALEDVRLAREAANTAEEQRLAAVKAAEEATRRAEETIASKRDAERHGEPTKLASLPKIEKQLSPSPAERGSFDGTWQVHRVGPSCPKSDVRFAIEVRKGVVSGYLGGGHISGSVSASGQFSFRHPASQTGVTLHYSGHLGKDAGRGTFTAGVGSLSRAQVRQLAAQFGQSMCEGSIALTRG